MTKPKHTIIITTRPAVDFKTGDYVAHFAPQSGWGFTPLSEVRQEPDGKVFMDSTDTYGFRCTVSPAALMTGVAGNSKSAAVLRIPDIDIFDYNEVTVYAKKVRKPF